MKIQELFQKDINRNIQGVVKIGQDTTDVVRDELDEYVVTGELLRYFHTFFENYRKGTSARTDKIGVWISGFFGSGKSHFLKILSYLVSGQTIDGKKAVTFFDGKIEDQTVLADMKAAGDISADIILFNIDAKSDADSKSNKDAIVKVFMKVFNEMQGFCGSMPWIADLERKMTVEGTYEAFKTEFERISSSTWESAREDFYFESDSIIEALSATQKMSAEAARHWCETSESNYNLDIATFAKRVREYIEFKSSQTGKKHYVVFLCDEMGQYMGSDGNLLLNLQTVVENLGIECGGRAWVIATGQEDISSIVKETKGGRDAFSKIIGRFDTRLSLTSANVDEVIKKRLLAKTENGADKLRLLYREKNAVIKNLMTFSPDTPEKKLYANEDDFIDVYPFIPYQFKLLQEVFTGIRTHGASGKHLSEGERSLLNAFQEAAMQYSSFSDGTLIPFDAFYRTIETFLDHNISKVIIQAQDNSRLQDYDIQILKLLFMVKYTSNFLPADLENLSTLMVENIDQDKLDLKKKVDESLRRLESEKLIIKNGNQFIFLTDEEQDVNREIREIRIDRSEIIDKVGDELLYALFGDNRKYRYGDRHDFAFNTIIDDRPRGQQRDEIGVRILTPYYAHGSDLSQSELMSLSMRENNVIVVLPNDMAFLDEMEQALQIDTYLRRNAARAETDAIADIKSTKSRESKQRKDRSKDLIVDALTKAEIYVSGSKRDIKESAPNARIATAFQTLIEGIYTKLHFINKPFLTTEDLRRLLIQTNAQMTLDGTESTPNKLAIEDMTTFITNSSYKNISTTMRSVLEYFGKAPYGWKDYDIAGVVLTLFKSQTLRFEFGGRSVDTSDASVVDYVTKRDAVDRLVIKIRVRVPQDLLNNAKELARELFNYSSMPNDEDGIMTKFKDRADYEMFKAMDSTWQNNVSISSMLGQYSGHRYPGRQVLESGMKLLKSIVDISDVKAFFEALQGHKGALLDYEEDVQDVKKFFTNQREIFDKAIKMLDIFEANRSYVLDKETLAIVTELDRITRLASPYSEIHKLPDLIDKFMSCFVTLLKAECDPIKTDIQQDKEITAADAQANGLTKEFGEKIRASFASLLDRLDRANNIYEAIAMRTESDRLKQRLIEEMQADLYRRAKENQGENAPAPLVRRTKTVSMRSLFAGMAQITSEAEIDRLAAEVKRKLKAELDDNTTIQIV